MASYIYYLDERRIRAHRLRDRVDALLEQLPSGVDVQTRWVTSLADAPLFGAGDGSVAALSTPSEPRRG